MAQKTVSFKNITITGYESDYILRTIEKTQDFYESALLKKWTPLLGNPTNILDIGANIGNHTIYWATHLSPKQITAFEPYPDNFECLCKNIENNRLSHVTAVPIAVGDKSGAVVVKSFDPENYGATTFQYAQNSDEGSRIAALDDLVEQYQLQDTDFIKIDTEGFELSVLKGMSKLLKKNTPVLWIEVTKDTVEGVMLILQSLHYVLVDMEDANILCIPKENANSCISLGQLMANSLSHLERVNQYYQNYETCKAWLKSRNIQLEKIKYVLQEKEEQAQQKEILDAELKQVKFELQEKEEQIEQKRKLEAQLVEQLKNAAIELTQEQQFLREVKQQLQLLNSRYQQVCSKNRQYEEKLNKIYGTWYGKIALKAYKVLKRVKHLIMRH